MPHPSPRDVALNPEWLPHAFDAGGQQLTSVFVPQSAREELLFLADAHFANRFDKATLPTAPVAAAATEAEQAPLHFIFHTSFCCSTLLARALDVPGAASSLREPNILVNLAERLIHGNPQQVRPSLELAARLLARPFASGEAVVVKPSNFANALIEPLLTIRPASRAVLLYSDTATFLRSLLKRGLLARINARKLYLNLSSWSAVRFGFSEAESFEQTDLQVAALAWLMHIAQFQQVAARFGADRVMILDAADLLADPARALGRVQAFFGLGLGQDRVSAIATGPVFSRHSKSSDMDYDSEARRRDHDALMEVHGAELNMVLQWLNAVAAQVGVPLRPRM
jgi:hypothetical protein